VFDQLDADAGILRGTGSGLDQDALGTQSLNLGGSQLVVAPNHHLGSKLSHVLHQVVSKRIVVIEDEDHSNS